MCVALPRPRSEFLKKSLAYRGAVLWYVLSNDIRVAENVNSFKRKVIKSDFHFIRLVLFYNFKLYRIIL